MNGIGNPLFIILARFYCNLNIAYSYSFRRVEIDHIPQSTDTNVKEKVRAMTIKSISKYIKYIYSIECFFKRSKVKSLG